MLRTAPGGETGRGSALLLGSTRQAAAVRRAISGAERGSRSARAARFTLNHERRCLLVTEDAGIPVVNTSVWDQSPARLEALRNDPAAGALSMPEAIISGPVPWERVACIRALVRVTVPGWCYETGA
jgi:hypothetical protein